MAILLLGAMEVLQYLVPLTLMMTSSALLSNSDVGNRRMLVDDPNFDNSRLQALEHQFQTLQSQMNSKLMEQDAEIQSLRVTLSNFENSRVRLGTTYIRWGRKSCPTVNGTTTVYSGMAGGRNFDEKDGGINTLCLPLNPESAPGGVSAYVHSGRLYGSEYEFSYNNIAMDDDVPCAVCHSRYASSSIMIPAKRSCPSRWMKQYDGFLTSEAHYTNHNGADFLCVDSNPEYATAGSRQHSSNGRLFYTVQAVCGSLPCPPYRSSQPIACVVCTT